MLCVRYVFLYDNLIVDGVSRIFVCSVYFKLQTKTT